MQSLRLPEGMTSISVYGQTLGENGVVRDVEDHVAREILAHDPRIKVFTPGGPDDPEAMPGGNDRKTAYLARVSLLDRQELFASARHLGVKAPATLNTEALREVVIRKAIDTPDNELPVLVSIKADSANPNVPGAGILMMPDDVATSANRGNDSLGKGHHSHNPARGSTFTQGLVAPVGQGNIDAAARPAPSGLGPVQLTGTQQPPFNQLDTETGKPSHDARMASFPISVPPINPQNGQPYADDDPRRPITSMPIARVTNVSDPASDALRTQAVQDAADRISFAAKARSPERKSEDRKVEQKGADTSHDSQTDAVHAAADRINSAANKA